MLFNPVILSVTAMMVLCLLKLNVIIAILISALIAGVSAGMGLGETMSILINGMGGNSETALSYILLGTLAVAINNSGLAKIIALKISGIVKNKKILLIFILAAIACSSQNLIPVHIAFIPILIPPLLPLMNKLKIDRRAVACALTFGLKAPYIVLPVGFGLIFQTIVKDQLNANNVPMTLKEVSSVNWLLGAGMLLGLLIAVFFSYRKPREYKINEEENKSENDIIFEKKHMFALIGAVIAFGVQLKTGSLPLGALFALMFMAITNVIPWKHIDETLDGGLHLMGFIAFVMLVAAGYGNVIRETGAVPELVEGVISIIGTNKILGAFVMLLVGLFVTLGIGTSFGTIPILAVIYCPLAISLGFSPAGTAILVAAAGALGDAGSPASDSTLGPTAGLNADGQHQHIWDTCVPTFLHYNIPLIIFGLIGSLVF
ncbi:sodium:proton antiporter [Fusobacterium perfoetens]|mgnify:CR=1 FL=1|uniref:Na+/H+ antiporter family protein n=1 Tax=Fusobacterium perfoetens TaxID=852 RepID=UPI0015A29E57|nr:Na+/H+ antiporter NhaC family protein [Fusobacterium perfoetens]MCF2626222.1 sodium:proton antiporter [Fusobacterium perfoetens]